MTTQDADSERPGGDGRLFWLGAGAAATALAASAFYNHAAARRAEAEHPPVGRFLEVDGTTLHHVDRGLGTPVVLLHGNGVSLDDWAASGVLDRVAAGHRAIAFDRPGFGYSERPRTTVWRPRAQAALIARALAELEVKDAVIVGHSWGTLVAIALALEHSEVTAGLVLLSGYYYGTVRPDALAAAPQAMPLIGDVLTRTFSPLSATLFGPAVIRQLFAPAPVPDSFDRFPKALAVRPKQLRATAADAAIMVPAAADLSRHYGELDLPVILMAGKGDQVAGVAEHTERLAADIRDSELRVIADQGHMVHYAAAAEVVASIDAVATRVAARRG